MRVACSRMQVPANACEASASRNVACACAIAAEPPCALQNVVSVARATRRMRGGEVAVHDCESAVMRTGSPAASSSGSEKCRWSSLASCKLAKRRAWPPPIGTRSKPEPCRKSSSSLSLVATENLGPCLTCNRSDGTASPSRKTASAVACATAGTLFSGRRSISVVALTSFWSVVSSKTRSDISETGRFGKRASNSLAGILSLGVWAMASTRTLVARRTWTGPLIFIMLVLRDFSFCLY